MKDPLAALPFEIGTELLSTLRSALEFDSPQLFTDVAEWAQTLLRYRGGPLSTLPRAIAALLSKLSLYVRASEIDAARAILKAALIEVTAERRTEVPAIDETVEAGVVARKYLDAVLDGDELRGTREVLLAVAHGTRTLSIYQDVLVPVLRQAGALWQRNEITIAQEHIVTASVLRLMSQLIDFSNARPHLDFAVASVTLGSTQHDVGARMVSDAFLLYGWHVHYIGSMVPVPDLLEYVDRVSIDVLAISAPLARDVTPVRALIAELEKRPIAPLVIVGGRAFSLDPSLWQKAGADGCALTPLMAVALASELIGHTDAQ